MVTAYRLGKREEQKASLPAKTEAEAELLENRGLSPIAVDLFYQAAAAGMTNTFFKPMRKEEAARKSEELSKMPGLTPGGDSEED